MVGEREASSSASGKRTSPQVCLGVPAGPASGRFVAASVRNADFLAKGTSPYRRTFLGFSAGLALYGRRRGRPRDAPPTPLGCDRRVKRSDGASRMAASLCYWTSRTWCVSKLLWQLE